MSLRKALRRGVRARVTCPERCRASARLKLGRQLIGRAKARRIAADRSRTVVVRLRRKALPKRGRNLRARLTVTVRSENGTKRLRRQVVLRRR
jgi:hypothetical protein